MFCTLTLGFFVRSSSSKEIPRELPSSAPGLSRAPCALFSPMQGSQLCTSTCGWKRLSKTDQKVILLQPVDMVSLPRPDPKKREEGPGHLQHWGYCLNPRRTHSPSDPDMPGVGELFHLSRSSSTFHRLRWGLWIHFVTVHLSPYVHSVAWNTVSPVYFLTISCILVFFHLVWSGLGLMVFWEKVSYNPGRPWIQETFHVRASLELFNPPASPS